MKDFYESKTTNGEMSIFDFEDEINGLNIEEMSVSLSSESDMSSIAINNCPISDINVNHNFPPYIRFFVDDSDSSIDIYQVGNIFKNDSDSYTIEAGVLKRYIEPFVINFSIKRL